MPLDRAQTVVTSKGPTASPAGSVAMMSSSVQSANSPSMAGLGLAAEAHPTASRPAATKIDRMNIGLSSPRGVRPPAPLPCAARSIPRAGGYAASGGVVGFRS